MQAHFLISLNVWFQTKELHVILYGCILLDDNNTPLLYVYLFCCYYITTTLHLHNLFLNSIQTTVKIQRFSKPDDNTTSASNFPFSEMKKQSFIYFTRELNSSSI